MITVDGKWVMEGLSREDEHRIKTSKELSDYINKVGFLPLFKNNIKGFSVEEMTASDCWWAGVPEEDPWVWREVIAGEGQIVYGKLFGNRAGFISKELYPYFAVYRRDGYDFDSRYEDGLASYKAKRIIDVLTEYDQLPSYELKSLAGFGKFGEKGFEGTLTLLQMQTYIVVKGFQRRINKKNEEYGWSIAVLALSEKVFGEDLVRSAYHITPEEAKDKIISHLQSTYTEASYKEIERLIRG